MRFFTIKTVWNNLQFLVLKTALVSVGMFIGIVYKDILEEHLLLITIVCISTSLWLLVLWVRKMLAEPHLEQVP
jgi:hypothetical protein